MQSHRSHRRKDEKEPITWGPMKFKWIEKNIQPGKKSVLCCNVALLYVCIYDLLLVKKIFLS